MTILGSVLGFRARDRFLAHLASLDLPVQPTDLVSVTDDDLTSLPAPAQRYLRFMEVVGRPRDWSLRARFQGQFRMRAGQPWMPFDAWQYNSANPVARVIDMRIDVAGVVPMFGTDTYLDRRGRMHGKVLGLVTVADGEGREFDLGELVTWVNDAAMLAPSMLLVPNAEWLPVDDASFDVRFTDGENTVTARLSVDEAGKLTDFRTDDRWYAGQRPPVRTLWSTPVAGWVTAGNRRVPAEGAAVWHFPDREFAYVRGRFVPETVEINVAPTAAWQQSRPA